MGDTPAVPRDWQAWADDIEDAHGRRQVSGYLMPAEHGPMYDPGGWGGSELPSLWRDPHWDTVSRLSRAFGVSSAALSAPGWAKALSVPAASPFVANDLWRSYRNIQQIKGNHPTQLNQDYWENALGRALMSGGYKK